MDKFDQAFTRLSQQIGTQDEKIAVERSAIEESLLYLANTKVTIFNFLKVLRVLKVVLANIGSITSACLTTQLSIQQSELEFMEAMRSLREDILKLQKSQ